MQKKIKLIDKDFQENKEIVINNNIKVVLEKIGNRYKATEYSKYHSKEWTWFGSMESDIIKPIKNMIKSHFKIDFS